MDEAGDWALTAAVLTWCAHRPRAPLSQKMSNKERKEYETLLDDIDRLEKRQTELETRIAQGHRDYDELVSRKLCAILAKLHRRPSGVRSLTSPCAAPPGDRDAGDRGQVGAVDRVGGSVQRRAIAEFGPGAGVP